MIETGEVFVAHDRVPGRARLRAPALKSRGAFGPLLEKQLLSRPGVHEVQVNAITGSVLVRFDPQRVSTQQLARWTAQSTGGYPRSGWTIEAPPAAAGPLAGQNNGRLNTRATTVEHRPAASAASDRRRGRREKNGASSPAPLTQLRLSRRAGGRGDSSLQPPSPKQERGTPVAAPPTLEAARRWASPPVEEIYAAVSSSPTGLTSIAAARSRARDGANRLPEVDRRTAGQILKDQLVSVPTLMLVGAVGLSVATGGLVDAVVIAAVLGLNGAIGFSTERYAEGAIRALQRLGSPRATVLRDGQTQSIPGAEVVVGDVVRLRPGDVVPADGRVIETHALSVDEAPLTGESVPVAKIREPITALASIAECRNLVFMGTAVATGHGRALITATGAKTQIGRINALVGGEVAPRTRMQEGLDDLAKRLGIDTLAVCAGLFALGVGMGLPVLGMLQSAVALAISAVPEGLPAVATTSLAIGMARMLRRQVVIRKLAAVEALGGITVLCVDKTGTLTLNRMQVVEVHVDGQPVPCCPTGDWAIGRTPTVIPPLMSGMPGNAAAAPGSGNPLQRGGSGDRPQGSADPRQLH
jgi:magnesium-transporting ATPase (P-type)